MPVKGVLFVPVNHSLLQQDGQEHSVHASVVLTEKKIVVADDKMPMRRDQCSMPAISLFLLIF